MGADYTHYVVLGVAVTKSEQIKELLNICDERIDDYDDNTYKKNISPNISGIHMIADGMNGDYVVVGKILAKGIEGGLNFTEVSDIDKQYEKILPEILKLDQLLGTKFSDLPPKVIAFTHWH